MQRRLHFVALSRRRAVGNDFVERQASIFLGAQLGEHLVLSSDASWSSVTGSSVA